MAFDWMLKSMAEKEKDIIDEFSDYWSKSLRLQRLSFFENQHDRL